MGDTDCYPRRACEIQGCMDPTMTNYNPKATFDTEPISSCFFVPEVVTGCTNPVAINWKEEAVVDDGSCIILGCTDKNATNYMPEATTDDNSCYTDRTDDVVDAIDDASELAHKDSDEEKAVTAGAGVLVAVMLFIPLTLIMFCVMCGLGSTNRKVQPVA